MLLIGSNTNNVMYSGEYDATWRVVDNIPRQELLAEIEVLG